MPSNSIPKLILIVYNVRSLHNVGSVFRTANGAGVSMVYLTGYTPSPVDELGRMRKEVAKTALGAEMMVPWERRSNIRNLVQKLKKEGVHIVALENTRGATDYRLYKPTFPLVLVLGNEVRGLSKNLLRVADETIRIPMRGKKESLNVSVACGIAVYKLLEGVKDLKD